MECGSVEIGKLNVHTAGLQATYIEYELLFFLFACGLTEKTEGGQFNMGNGVEGDQISCF